MHQTPKHIGRRILVVANQTLATDTLHDVVRSHVADVRTARVLAVAPVPTTGDETAAATHTAAVRRLQACVEALSGAGVDVEGLIGDADPLRAVEGALRIFPADCLIIATQPDEPGWRADGVIETARLRFDLPTTRFAVDAA
jgi:hypothetical protein